MNDIKLFRKKWTETKWTISSTVLFIVWEIQNKNGKPHVKRHTFNSDKVNYWSKRFCAYVVSHINCGIAATEQVCLSIWSNQSSSHWVKYPIPDCPVYFYFFRFGALLRNFQIGETNNAVSFVFEKIQNIKFHQLLDSK